MDILYFVTVPAEKTTISILKFLLPRHGQQYTALLTMSDVYAVLTHNKYLINQLQNSFLSVKKELKWEQIHEIWPLHEEKLI